MNIKTFFILVFALLLASCAATVHQSEINQLQREYLNGYYKKAFHHAKILSQQNDQQAQYTLGYLYYYGYGTQQNTDAGYYWIERAAEAGYPSALNALHILRSRYSLRTRAQREFLKENETD